MKNTLEICLAEAKPEQKSAEYSTLPELLEYYLTRQVDVNSNLRNMQKINEKWTPAQYVANWEYIPYFIGILYRMSNDGYEPFKFMGLTSEEESQFRELCLKIRQSAQGTTPTRSTITKQLYDQIKQLGF